MRSLFVAIVLFAVVAIATAGREKRKSFGADKVNHGDRPHHHKRLRKQDLDGHKPVSESPDTVYKDEWMKMTRYTKTKSTACKRKCGKRQICLVDQTTGESDCFSIHSFREGRRLFRNFRNHDVKGVKQSIEDYSKHHQKSANKHKHHHKIHKDHHQHIEHPQHNKIDSSADAKQQHAPEVNHVQHKDHPQHKDNKQNKDHPQHKDQKHNKDHPQHKDHKQNEDHPQHKDHKQNKDRLQHKDHKQNKDHLQHKDHKDHPQHKNHAEHKKKEHKKHPEHKQHSQHHKLEIVHNHSGPQQKVELHAQLVPNTIHGHIVPVSEDEALKAREAKVSIHKSVQKAAVKRLMKPIQDHHLGKTRKGHFRNDHHKAHKGHHHKHHGKHSQSHKGTKNHVCTKEELDVMSKRLTGWFALLHARREETTHHKIPIHKHEHKCDCQETAVWALHQFDLNGDNHLNHTEVKHLETNQNEPCLKPFIESCDHNLDAHLSRKEWCCCFAKTQPPCLQRKQSLQHHHLLGAFIPRCDETGYYQKEQCHSGTGYCWCVDLNGNEIPNTRAMKKAHCEILNVMGYKKN